MAEESAFRGIISFLTQIGVYDIILPFLLVFTIVFAILEKTMVLGKETIKDKGDMPKKNLNAMVAFSTAFLVIASVRLVSIINEVMANIVLLLVLAISFLMLVGSFYSKTDDFAEFMKKSTWTKFFFFFMFLGVVVIFLNALGWLELVFGVVAEAGAGADWAATIVFLVIIFGFMFYIVSNPTKEGKD